MAEALLKGMEYKGITVPAAPTALCWSLELLVILQCACWACVRFSPAACACNASSRRTRTRLMGLSKRRSTELRAKASTDCANCSSSMAPTSMRSTATARRPCFMRSRAGASRQYSPLPSRAVPRTVFFLLSPCQVRGAFGMR
eukprot:3133872-Rhodomonas_salina.2